jgi:hypothetical protein
MLIKHLEKAYESITSQMNLLLTHRKIIHDFVLQGWFIHLDLIAKGWRLGTLRIYD